MLATVFREAVLGGTSQASRMKRLIPDWSIVQDALGIIAHRGNRDQVWLTGTLFLDGGEGGKRSP
jgi:hypothetical protein